MGIRQVQVKNLVVNGNFENGSANWNIQGNTSKMAITSITAKYGTSSMRSTGNTYSQECLLWYDQNNATGWKQKILSGHKYYFSMWAINQSNVDMVNHVIFGAAYEGVGIPTVPPNQNTWTQYSGVSDLFVTVSPNPYLGLEWSAANGNGQPFYVDGVLLVDLTASFGAGKEPAKIWCDNNITYFEGSGTLTLIEEFGIATTCTPPAVEVWEPTKVEVSVGSTIDVMKKVYAVCGTCYSGQGIILGQNWDVAI